MADIIRLHPYSSTNNCLSHPQAKSTSDVALEAAIEPNSLNRVVIGGNTPNTNLKLKGPLWVLVVVSVLSSTFLFGLDTTITAVLQPKIIETFGEIEKLPWVSVGAGLGGVSVNLVWGKFYGQFNNKYLFISAVIIFEVGSVLCGAASSVNVFIVGRTLSGLGGSGLYIGAISIITAFTTIEQRPLYMGFLGVTWSVATVLGPIIGGVIGDSKGTWRWAFYLNLCVVAVAPVYIFLLPSSAPSSQSSTFKEKVKRLDLTGTVLLAGLTTALTMAISFGGSVFSWKSGQIIGLLVCGSVLTILFVVQQLLYFLTTEEDRLFPVQFFYSRELCILFAQVAVAIPCLYLPMYFIPLFFQFVHGDKALDSGVRLLPFIFVIIFSTMLNGALLPKFIYMPLFLVGGLLATAGAALLHSLNLESGTPSVYGYTSVIAFGTGLFVQAPFAIAQASVEVESVPLVTAFISCAQISSITFSLAIGNSIFVNQAFKKVGAVLPGVRVEDVQLAIAGVNGRFLDGLDAVDQRRVLEAIVSSIDDVYIVAIFGAAAAVVLSVFMKREKVFGNN
ncbi:hypothetical protein HYALB_00014015, partial [Hymenoscyphus albidus]